MNKIKHEGIGTCTRIEISQDADNADQKVKCFLKGHKHTDFCRKHIFNFLFPKFIFQVHILQIFQFSPPENASYTQKLIKIINFSITLMLFLQSF